MGNLILPKYLSDEIRKRAAEAGRDAEDFLETVLQKSFYLEDSLRLNKPRLIKDPITGLLIFNSVSTNQITTNVIDMTNILTEDAKDM